MKALAVLAEKNKSAPFSLHNTDIAQKLFGILNFIAEELLTKPK
jgi:hypothetical protein